MLTEAQRDYLDDGPEGIDAEEKPQKVRNYRSNIRKRVKEALRDFERLAENMELRDIEQIFYEPQPDMSESEIEKAKYEAIKSSLSDSVEPFQYLDLPDESSRIDRIPDAIAFLYLGTIAEEMAPEEPNPYANNPDLFEMLIMQGVYKAHTKRRNQIVEDIDVSIDVELGPKVDEIESDNLEELSHAELGLLRDQGEISMEEFFEATTAGEDLDDLSSGVFPHIPFVDSDSE
jgi:hypothetical protein